MRIGLILSGEVQVDIRLLISLESKEGLKGNVKALLWSSWLAALWADLSGISHPAIPDIALTRGESKSLYLHDSQ